jgi:hypothetical protein
MIANQTDGTLLACVNTNLASQAAVIPIKKLRLPGLTFRVMAPGTPERASLEKHSGAQARAIVY